MKQPSARPSLASPATHDQAASDVQHQLLSAITAIQSAYISGDAPDAVCRIAVQSAMAVASAHCGFIAELGKSSDAPVHLQRLIVQTEVPCPADSWELALSDVVSALYESCAGSGFALIDPRLSDHVALAGMARHIGCISFLALPIRVQNETMGLLCLSRSDEPFQAADAGRLAPLIGTLGQLLSAYQATAAARASSEALADANQLHHAILEAAIEGIFLINQRGLVATFNAAAQRLTGYASDEITGHPASLLIPEAYAQPIVAWLSGAKVGDAGYSSASAQLISFLHKEGVALKAYATFSQIEIGTHRYLKVVLRDASERLRVEATIAAREARQSAMIESAIDSIISFDKNGMIIEYNLAAENTFGHSRSRAMGQNLGNLLFTPEHLAPLTRTITRMLIGSKPIAIGERIEARAVHADGHEIDIEYAMSAALVDGQYIITAFLRDITGRKQKDAEVKHALDMLKGIFQLSPDGCLVFNSNGYVTDCNPSFAYMVGYRREHLLGMDSTQIDKLLLSLGASHNMYTPIFALHDEAMDTLELTKPRYQALQRTIRLSFTEYGTLICKALYLRDITREMEVDRMKSDFLSTAAHELRTPMASIHGFSELLMMRQYDEKTRAELIGTIHRQSSKLIGLVNELLDLARIEARGAIELRVGSHALEPLIQLATQTIQLTPQHRIELRLSEDLPAAYVDPEKFHQMLLNVLSNAVKYSPSGGCIQVRAEPAKRKGQPMARIEVSDPGLGMTPEQVKRIFERFFRADPTGSIPGTGLGMALVKEIAELHKGEIDVESTPNVGTTVRIWLPAVTHAKPDAQAPER